MKNKFALIAACLMIILALPMTVSAQGRTDILLTADKTSAAVGDVVTFSVHIGAVENMQGLQFRLVLPDGLSYIEGSSKVTDGLLERLNSTPSGTGGEFAAARFAEQSRSFIAYGAGCYSCKNPTAIMSFSCRIDSASAKSLVPSLTDCEVSDDRFELIEVSVDNSRAVVSIGVSGKGTAAAVTTATASEQASSQTQSAVTTTTAAQSGNAQPDAGIDAGADIPMDAPIAEDAYTAPEPSSADEGKRDTLSAEQSDEDSANGALWILLSIAAASAVMIAVSKNWGRVCAMIYADNGAKKLE
ncbi:MAG: hypothetical protein IJP17_02935 [Clostridia bacterium]|nr:hypothetical protein [Clostridia bacterium]